MKKNKILIICLTTIILFILMAGTTFAKTVTVTKDGTVFSVDIDGVTLQSDVAPRVENGTTLVPMRVIFEALDAIVNYNSQDHSITATRNNTIILLYLNETKAYVNGEEKILAVPAKAIDGRTLVPLRFVSEALGEKVNYVVKAASDPDNTTASSYEETYYDIAENMADAMDNDSLAKSCLISAYNYNEYYKDYGDLEFLSAAQTQYKNVPIYLDYSLECIEKAIGNCGGFSEYSNLKNTLKNIQNKYQKIDILLPTYSDTNLNTIIDTYMEISELWNTAMSYWTTQKP